MHIIQWRHRPIVRLSAALFSRFGTSATVLWRTGVCCSVAATLWTAREQRCGLCDEQTPMWHHEARSEALRRDPLHAALRATGRRATGNGLLRSS